MRNDTRRRIKLIVGSTVTLILMLSYWISKGRPHLPKMKSQQTILYISDGGAYGKTQWLFVTGTTISAAAFIATVVILVRWVILYIPDADADASDTLVIGLTLSAAILAAIGSAGAILLAVYDKHKYKVWHHRFLGVFL